MNKKIKYLLFFVLVGMAASASAQSRRISGNVYNRIDGPVMMANVVERDANNRIIEATQTDINGNFSMVIKNPKDYLVVTYVGYQPARVPLNTSQTSFKIEMKDANTIKEVEVTAKKPVKTNGLSIPEREVSVAQQSLNMDDMAGLAFTSADEALQGKIAGLDITMNSGNLGSGTSMRLRGVSTINGNANPLIVVDGNIFDLPDDATNLSFDSSVEDLEEQFSTLLSVNVEDIQSIDVLKDAGATAIWGARGTNGVISIRLRRGSKGPTRVNFSYRFTGSWQPSGYNMLDGDGYTMMLKEAYFNPKQSTVASNMVELNYDQSRPMYYYNFNKNTDWVNAMTQFGQGHKYYLTLSGGGEKANFRVSGGYEHQTGAIIKQKLDQFTTRITLDYYVSDRIKFMSNFGLTFTDNQRNCHWDDGDQSFKVNSLLPKAYGAMPNMSIYEYNQYGQLTGDYYNMLPSYGAAGNTPDGYSSYYLSDRLANGNPVAIANLAWNKQKTYRLTPQFQLQYDFLGKPTEDEKTKLTYLGEVYMDVYNESTRNYYPSTVTTTAWYNGVNRASSHEYKSLSFTTRHKLTFIPQFENKDYSYQGMLNAELTTGSSSTQDLSTRGLPTGIEDPTADAYMTALSSSTGQWRSMAAYLTNHFAYKGGRYSADVTVRADGSTKFGAGNKWGIFPGVSGRWNIIDEPWMKFSEKWLSMLSLNASWGLTGNPPRNEYLMYNRYANYGTYGSAPGSMGAIYPQNLRLTELKWEKTQQWNWGAKLGLLEDLFTFDLNIYSKKTTDLLMEAVGIPSSSGYSTLAWRNVGTLRNRGWELFANSGKFAKMGKFYMKASFNMSQNFNNIKAMDATVLATMNADYNYKNQNYLNRLQIGNAIGSMYGFHYLGVYQYDYEHSGYTETSANTYGQNTAAATGGSCPIARDAQGNIITDAKGNPLPMYFNYGSTNYQFTGGDVMYEDINHDGNINELDIIYLGNTNPKLNGGFGVDFYYGKWYLKTSFNFRVGGKIINMARMTKESMRNNSNQSAAVNYRWRKNGDLTEIPRAMNSEIMETYNSLASDRYVENGDYTRFQYMQIGYSFETAQLKKWGMNNLTLSISAQNIFFWSKYKGVDPEHSPGGWGVSVDNDNTPRSKQVTANINVGF